MPFAPKTKAHIANIEKYLPLIIPTINDNAKEKIIKMRQPKVYFEKTEIVWMSINKMEMYLINWKIKFEVCKTTSPPKR